MTQTLPVATYLELQSDPDAAIALSLVLMVVSVARAGLAARPLGAGADA